MNKDGCDYDHDWEIVIVGTDRGKFRCSRCGALSGFRPDRETLMRLLGVGTERLTEPLN